ncbi:MAG: sulfotransferase domain-containing protein [Halieaceae bacterium]|nr:sulfotransferase domain-containing protein [Halieaceae bacterium]
MVPVFTECSIRLERWYRGRREFRQLGQADAVVASYGKAGRTWLRVMISRYCQLRFGIAEDLLLGFDNYHQLNPAAPKLLFTHDNYLRGYTGNLDNKKDYYRKKTLLLARRPQDVAVSQFFQWRYRMRPRKKLINRYPPHGADISLWEFVNHKHQGLSKIIEYLNAWAEEAGQIEDFAFTRYEDLRVNPQREMSRIIGFLELEPRDDWIQDCVEFASLERLRAKEAENYFSNSGSRMKSPDPGNPNASKVRAAKVGGYRDHFSAAQLAELDRRVAEQLSPMFGYFD